MKSKQIIKERRTLQSKGVVVIMEYLMAFLIGGLFCAIGQILIDYTKLTPARILVAYVVAGVILGGLNLYKRIKDFDGGGATVP